MIYEYFPWILFIIILYIINIFLYYHFREPYLLKKYGRFIAFFFLNQKLIFSWIFYINICKFPFLQLLMDFLPEFFNFIREVINKFWAKIFK